MDAQSKGETSYSLMFEAHVDCLIALRAGGLQDLVGGGDYRRLEEDAWQVKGNYFVSNRYFFHAYFCQ